MNFRILVLVAVLIALPAVACAQERAMVYGDLRGRFVCDGDPPAPRPIPVIRDREGIGLKEIPDETLVVHPKNHGIANVCVWMYRKRGEDPPPIHPSYDLNPEMDDDFVTRTFTAQKGRFTPRVLPLRTGEKLLVENGDRFAYNAKIDTFENPPSSVLVAPERMQTFTFHKREVFPCPVSDNIHPWMRAYLIIQDHPYMAVTDRNGNFEIKNIPAGEWTFVFWHEKIGYVRELTIDGEQVQWPRGRKQVKITSMPTDLGEVKISAKLFRSD